MKKAPANLFELVPVRAVRWEDGADGRLVLLAPKFTNRLLVRFLVPRLKKPELRVHLDEIGTFVWRQCDGETPVSEIGRRAWAKFGGERDAVEQRTAEFLARLDRARCVKLQQRGATAVV